MTPGRVTSLQNINCAYCGDSLTEVTSTREHVLARRFVPRGALETHWNLVLQACRRCNEFKGGLEDEISAISMQPPLVGPRQEHDRVLHENATRKAQGSTGVRQDRGLQRTKVGGSLMPGGSVSFELVSPPSGNEEQISALAQMHIGAFFYLTTYDRDRRAGGFWVGGFRMLNWAGRSDWGNALQRGFTSHVGSWPTRFLVETASGFFKATIRRDPAAACWAWALEWNQNYRVVGFGGDTTAIVRHAAPRARDFADWPIRRWRRAARSA